MSVVCLLCFFFNDTATTEIYTLSLHDALPISRASAVSRLTKASRLSLTIRWAFSAIRGRSTYPHLYVDGVKSARGSGDDAARMIPSHDAGHETRPLPRLGRHPRAHPGQQPDGCGRCGQPDPYAERGDSPGARAPTLRRVFHRVESATRRDGRDQHGRGRPPRGLGERAARSPLYRLAALSPHGRGWLRLPQAQARNVPRARASLWRRSRGLDARRRCGEGPPRRGRGGRRNLRLGARLLRRGGGEAGGPVEGRGEGTVGPRPRSPSIPRPPACASTGC